MRPGRAHFGIVAGVAALVVLLDQLSKWWVLENLEPGVPRPLVWTLQLNLQRNSGAAFSFGAGSGFGRFVPILALVVVGVLLWQGRTGASRLGAVALGLVAGGAIGNVIDRIARADGGGVFSGRVVDFLDLQWWPVFNVADMGVVVGCVLLVLVVVFQPPTADGGPDGEGDGEGAGSPGPAGGPDDDRDEP